MTAGERTTLKLYRRKALEIAHTDGSLQQRSHHLLLAQFYEGRLAGNRHISFPSAE